MDGYIARALDIASPTKHCQKICEDFCRSARKRRRRVPNGTPGGVDEAMRQKDRKYLARFNRGSNISRERISSKMDSAFLEEIYTGYYKNVYNFICFRVSAHHDSEDLASAVFENAIRKYHTYKPELASVEAWLIGIAKNVVADYMRSKKGKVMVPLYLARNHVSPVGRPEDIAVKNDESGMLIRAMAKLRKKERDVLSMKFATGLKNVEIAKILGISESHAGVIIYRSARKLKKLYEKEGGTFEA